MFCTAGASASLRDTRRPRGRQITRAALAAFALTATLPDPAPAHATMFKCRTPDGRITYSDQACPNGGGAWKPRPNVTVLPSGSFTGGSKKAGSASADGRPGWLKPIDPIGDCKRRGGEIDREMRACRLP